MADLAVWQRTIVDEEGNVVPGAEVEVRREDTGQLAEIFSDREGVTPLPNPFSSFSNGFARFYVESGAYRVVATGAGATNTWRFVPLGTAAEYPIDSLALFDDKIVRIPTDYPTIMDAIRDLYTPRMASGKEITILLEGGYRIPPGSEAM